MNPNDHTRSAPVAGTRNDTTGPTAIAAAGPPMVGSPLFISSRLMAAYRIEHVGTEHVGTVHLLPLGRDDEGRLRYRYVIEDADGVALEEGDDLRSGGAADLDPLAAMATLLAFLEHAANSTEINDGDLFTRPVIEWARMHRQALAVATVELDLARDVDHARRTHLDLSTAHLPRHEMEQLRTRPSSARSGSSCTSTARG